MKPECSHFDSVDDTPLNGMIGSSSAMKEVYRLVRVSAQFDSSVLILGETGTGKGLIAKSLHDLGRRSGTPFVHVNCDSFTDDLLDVELFGAAGRLSSDPGGGRTGQLEIANGGTIFLDNINATSATIQARLLQVILNRRFLRTGSRESIEVDVRVIATSHVDLNVEVIERRFREDLYWRLNIVPISVPPLRRRDGDVTELARYFLSQYSQYLEKPIRKIAPDAMKALVEYQWPGNIWELQNYIERAIVLTQSDPIERAVFPAAVIGNAQAAQVAVFRPSDEESLIREFVHSRLSKSENDVEDLLAQIVDPVEKELLEQTMKLCNQTQITAAKRLGMNRNTLYKKLVKYGLVKPKSSGSATG